MYLAQHAPKAPVNDHDSLTARRSSGSRGGGRTHRRPNNSGSALLTDAENANLFGAIGSERVSLAAGVAQLLQGEGRQWRKVHVGVALLIKDYERRVYGLWMIDLFNGRQLWEQVLYKNFRATYYAKCPRFLSFEGDTAVYGLSFSDTSEADNFKAHLDKRAAGESQNRRGSVAPGSAGPSKQSTPPRLGGPHQGGSNKVTPMMPAMGGGGITTLGAVHPMHHMSTGGVTDRAAKSGKAAEKKAAGKKGGKPKLRKEDIGNPTEFKHLAHVGWNANEGSDVQVMEGEPMDATVRELLKAAGHDPDKMKKGDLKFAYQWLDEIGFDPKQPLPAQGGAPPGFEAVPGVTLRPATTGGIGRATPAASHMGSNGGGARAVPPPRPPPMATGPPLGRPLPQPPSQQHTTVVAAPPVQPHYYIQDGHRPAPTVPPVAHANGSAKRPPPPAPPSQPPTVNNGSGGANLAPMAAVSSVPPPPPPPPPQLLMSGGVGGSSAPPPPPPPPGQEMKPALGGGGASRPPPPQQAPSANLLQQIQAGAKLRRVEVDPGRAPVPTNPPTSRDQMMKQIQQGAQLKHVDPTEVEENRKSGTALQSFDGIAGALARALEERRRNMMQGEDTDDDDSDNGGANNDSEWEDE